MKFTKMQGSGNDFILIDGVTNPAALNSVESWEDTAAALCDRHFGIGADGLILVLPSDKADFKMRIFNSDGSEAEMCGNGLRCFSRFVWENKLTEKDIISVETLAGIMVPAIIVENNVVKAVEVDLGEPHLKPAEIPFTGASGEEALAARLEATGQKFTITAVSMGNPHCVIFTEDVEKIDLEKIGPAIENHPAFPNQTNVEFVQVLTEKEIKVRVWERGAGATLACGTGAAASVVAASLNKKTERRVLVHLPGGNLLIEWNKDNHVILTGPAEKVFVGEIEI
jgi:diaminopimelate epimerase